MAALDRSRRHEAAVFAGPHDNGASARGADPRVDEDVRTRLYGLRVEISRIGCRLLVVFKESQQLKMVGREDVDEFCGSDVLLPGVLLAVRGRRLPH